MTPLRLLARNVALLWILIGALIALLVVAWLHRPARPLLTPEVQHTLDSLARVKEHDESAITILKAWADSARTASDSAAGRARVYEGAASRIGSRADTLAAEARKLDPTKIQGSGAPAPHTVEHADTTARLWKMAYEERTYERDTLLLALKFQQKATLDAQVAADKFRVGLDDSERRREAVERVNADLVDAVKRAERGCRVLWIPCPNRTTTLAAGVVIGAAGLAALTH